MLSEVTYHNSEIFIVIIIEGNAAGSQLLHQAIVADKYIPNYRNIMLLSSDRYAPGHINLAGQVMGQWRRWPRVNRARCLTMVHDTSSVIYGNGDAMYLLVFILTMLFGGVPHDLDKFLNTVWGRV